MRKRKILFLGLLGLLLGLPFLTNSSIKIEAAEPGDDLLWMSTPPEIKPLEDGEFTLSLLGDTQKTVQNAPKLLENSFDWMVTNKDALNLKYVCGLGDIVDDVDNEDTGRDNIGDDPVTQLTNASNFYRKLKNADINFSLILGNHDYEDMAFFNRRFEAFQKYFPLETTYTPAKNGEGYQGSMNSTIENTYHYFQNGNDKYMIVCIGHHPNDEIINWANSIIKQNLDRKVILMTHGYLSGGDLAGYPYYEYSAGGYGERTPQGQKIFERIVYNNENVEMVLCGHSLGDDNKRIVRSDTYNKFGGVVHQFMVNPADIDLPAGGCGLLALMTFRNDGTVDVNYYAPSLGKYFNPDSQFTFDYANQMVEPSKEVTLVKKELTSNLSEDYSMYAVDSNAFADKAYSYHNVKITNRGLEPTNDYAYITYKFVADSDSVIRDALTDFNYTSSNRKGGVVISTSNDGVNFQAVNSFDGVSQSARKTAPGCYKSRLRLRNYIYDNKEIYIRISFLKDSVNNIALTDFANKFQKINVIYRDGKFGIDLKFDDYKNYDVTDWAKNTIYINDMLVMSGYLGTGRADDYAGARGEAIWRFDAPQGSTIDSLIFDAKGRLTLSEKDTFLPPYCLQISYRLDGGDFITYISEQKSGKTSFKYDLSSLVKDHQSVEIKLELWGDSWNSVALSNLSISGGYKYAINYHCGEGTNNEKNPTTYGTSDKSINLYDPTAPQYYEFAGWYDNEKYEGEAMFEIAPGTYGALDLYAKYDAVTRNISYHLNGGTNSKNNPKTFEIVNGVSLEGATRNGYTFKGWYLNESFTGEPVTCIAKGTDNDVDLYAKFLKNYRISYVTNGGTIDPNEKFDTFTEEDQIVLPIPTKSGYTFEGWYLEKTYENKIEKIEYGTNKTLIVYAKWSKSSSSGCGGSIEVCSVIISLFALAGIVILLEKRKLYK